MPPVKEVHCSKCGGRHPRPVGKKCVRPIQGNSDISITPTVSSEAPQQQHGIEAIINKLNRIEERQDQLANEVFKMQTERSQPQPLNASTPQKSRLEGFTNEGVVPSLDFIKTSNAVQQEVARRLRLLDSDVNTVSGKHTNHSKSGRYRTCNTNIQRYIQWPQEHVFVGSSRKPITYDELNVQQFLLGHLVTAMAPENIADRENMLQYIIKLLRESVDGSFIASKGAHACVLQELERGAVTWSDVQKIDEIRTLYTRKSFHTENSKRDNDTSNGGHKKVVCSYYNKNKCTKTTDHVTNNIMYRHVCSYCYKVTGKCFGHQENDCNRKSKQESSN